MTASRTRRSRLESCSTRLISSKLVTTSEESQVGGEGVQSQPPGGGQPQPRIGADFNPSSRAPTVDVFPFLSRKEKTAIRTKTEIDLLGKNLRGFEGFRTDRDGLS